VEFLDDRATDCVGVLALDDDRPAGSIDDLLHEYVPASVGGAVGLPDVLVAEVPEHIHQILELEPREVVQQFRVAHHATRFAAVLASPGRDRAADPFQSRPRDGRPARPRVACPRTSVLGTRSRP